VVFDGENEPFVGTQAKTNCNRAVLNVFRSVTCEKMRCCYPSQPVDNKLLANLSSSIKDEQMPFFLNMALFPFDKLERLM